MIRVSSTNSARTVGRYQDVAVSQPIVVTRDGRDRTVMISAGEYQFDWPGPDLRRVGDRGDSCIAYGFLPSRLFAELHRCSFAA